MDSSHFNSAIQTKERENSFSLSVGVKVTGPPRGKTKITIDGAVEKGRGEIHLFCLLSLAARLLFLPAASC